MAVNSVSRPWLIGDRSFTWGHRTYLMGILNVTPDSFSDGGLYASVEQAVQQAQYLVQAGVDMIDIGGQSTRPGAETIAVDTELQRVVPVIQAIRASDQASLRTMPISVDTTVAAVAAAAVAAGANMVNDISGGTFDSAMLSTVADLGVPIFLMHIRGTPATMQQHTDYTDLLGEIHDCLQQRLAAAIAAGIDPAHVALDPGIGFAKTPQQNVELLRHLSRFRDLGCPLLVGPSRKSFIGWILDQPDPSQRMWGTAAACCGAIAQGADILRVHDGAEMFDVIRVADAIWRSS